MNYRSAKIINDNFKLDEKFVPYHDGVKKIKVEDAMAKGYVYAAMYFYDEVNKEIVKLEKMIRKTVDEVMMESPAIELPILLVEVSKRVRDIIGDDGLDLLIKNMLGERDKHLSLLPTADEKAKYEKICQSIFTELAESLFATVLGRAESGEGEYRSALTEKYVAAMTERQKKLFSPALRMIAFVNGFKLVELKVSPEFEVVFQIEKLKKPFAEQEEIIKDNLKKLMSENS